MPDINPDRLAESSPAVVELLRREIERDSRITFARFMELAVGHPEHGYYAGGAARAGFTGDFLTAPETDPIFGHTLARQFAECWERLGRPERFVVREFGAGAGTLALRVLEGLQRERPETLAAAHYELFDLNPSRTGEALERLGAAGYGEHVAAAGNVRLTGVLLANELLDAFPVHRLIWSGDELHELYVTWRDGWFTDEPGPLSDPCLAAPFTALKLEAGQQVEVSPAAQAWAATLGERIERGYALLIDYGYPSSELYSSRRAGGTLMGYRAQMASPELYRHVGRQDLTAHVDFTAVSAAARRGGLTELGLTTQAYFFAGLGIEELLMERQRTATDPYTYVNAREAVLHLMDPRGLGRFRVLGLAKNVPLEPPLRGFSFNLGGLRGRVR
jgi:SAM-dependent MidA family methyltransferase